MDTIQIIDNLPGAMLTENQMEFARHFSRYRNPANAWKAAFNPNASYSIAAAHAWEMLREEPVMNEIKRVTNEASKNATADVTWLMQRFLDIATADPRELIGLKIGCCRFCHGEDHAYQWREREYIEALRTAEEEGTRYPDPAGGFGFNATFPPSLECPQCHGEGIERFVPRDTDNLSDQALLLYGGVKVKRDGYEIIIADRQKALETVGRMMGAFQDKVQHSGAIGALVAVQDLSKIAPAEAARAYREMIAGRLAAA